jgi:valyl-tRNA synthetase
LDIGPCLLFHNPVKKDVDPMREIAKTFDPAQIEARWYAHWEKSGAFIGGTRPDAKPYALMIPPPNVTGALHIGHALNNSLQDVLVRLHRLKGYDCLWMPGTDHAGIATQMVVERNLAAQGMKRSDMGRSAFLEHVWEWKAQSGGTITRQLRRLGASCDWSRERFTMDPGFSAAVLKVFVTLHERGLIYRDKRLVNWDPHFKTSISDLEVEMRDVQGSLVHFRYPLADDATRFIVVATTRPETMLGDSAVAVHPDDARYQDLVGQMLAHPITGRRIPVIADSWADPEFGSGAVKITPAHDFNDWAVYERHKHIGYDNIFTDQAHIADLPFIPRALVGLPREAARAQIIERMESLGLVEKIEPKSIQMPYGDRSGVVVEPYLTDQWYVDAKKLAQAAIAAVDAGEMRFVPGNWKRTWDEWMHNIQPWCISRQLWWGHQIPAWYDEQGRVFVAQTEEEAQALAGSLARLTRDSDVLDTWFSSALWPFATLGWPEQKADLARFYPTNVLVTAFDIIFFWVARMMMQGLEFTKQVPFHTCYIHGLVRDAKGQKMSKSKGNVVDPIELIDRYGADALRFFMCAMESQGRDIKLSQERVEGYRNFATKLWNAARFCQMNGIAGSPTSTPPKAAQMVNQWIMAELASCAARLDKALADYRFDELANTLYHFIWHDFCDWYLELIKPVLQNTDSAAQADQAETRQVAGFVLDQILVMLHPIMPFITEELWHGLSTQRTQDLIVSQWPALGAVPAAPDACAEIAWLIGLITKLRSARTELNVPPAAIVALHVAEASAQTKARLLRQLPALQRLARVNSINLIDTPLAQGALQLVHEEAVFCVPIADIIDINAEKARLAKNLDKARADAAMLAARLANANFIERAKPEAVEEARDKLAELSQLTTRLAQAIARLGA